MLQAYLATTCCNCAAEEEDWYLSTIGPKADGTWGYAQYDLFERLCQLVITSSKAQDFAWSAGRALMRYELPAATGDSVGRAACSSSAAVVHCSWQLRKPTKAQ